MRARYRIACEVHSAILVLRFIHLGFALLSSSVPTLNRTHTPLLGPKACLAVGVHHSEVQSCFGAPSSGRSCIPAHLGE